MDDDWEERPEIEYIAFAVKGDTCIDIERYRVANDMDTNAADFVYDNERITVQTMPLNGPFSFMYSLWGAGWVVTDDVADEPSGWQANVERREI
jgi:hypothetical protein